MDMRPSRKKIFGGWSKAYLNYNFYIDETLEQNKKRAGKEYFLNSFHYSCLKGCLQYPSKTEDKSRFAGDINHKKLRVSVIETKPRQNKYSLNNVKSTLFV